MSPVGDASIPALRRSGATPSAANWRLQWYADADGQLPRIAELHGSATSPACSTTLQPRRTSTICGSARPNGWPAACVAQALELVFTGSMRRRRIRASCRIPPPRRPVRRAHGLGLRTFATIFHAGTMPAITPSSSPSSALGVRAAVALRHRQPHAPVAPSGDPWRWDEINRRTAAHLSPPRIRLRRRTAIFARRADAGDKGDPLRRALRARQQRNRRARGRQRVAESSDKVSTIDNKPAAQAASRWARLHVPMTSTPASSSATSARWR